MLVSVMATVALGLFGAPDASAAARSYANVRVQSDGWGDALPEDVQAVALSSIGVIHSTMSPTTSATISLRNGSEPITAFRSSSSAPFDVAVAVSGRQWAQLAYQFSHEYCHVLTLNDRRAATRTDWFEESLCEAISLLALERMAVTWKTSPPYPNWKSFAPSLADYATAVERRSSRQLPKKMSFAQWFACSAKSRDTDPYDRERNGVIANQLLSRIRNAPSILDAVIWLNRGTIKSERSFDQLLTNWKQAAPASLRKVIDAFTEPLRQSTTCPSNT